MFKKWIKRGCVVDLGELVKTSVTPPASMQGEVLIFAIEYRRAIMDRTGILGMFGIGSGAGYYCTATIYPSCRSFRYRLKDQMEHELVEEVVRRVGETLTTESLVRHLTKSA